jgi:hypothetical protein
VVIAAGMTIGTMFTLFITPAVYTYLARDHQKAARLARAASASVEPPDEQPVEPVAPASTASEALTFNPAPAPGPSELRERRAAKRNGRRRLPEAAE